MEQSLVKSYKATEVMAPLVRIAKECFETECLYKLIDVYVVRMPEELGGGVIGVTWSKEQAHKMIESTLKDKIWDKEREFRKQYHLKEMGDFIIEKSIIGSLCMIGD